MEPGAAAIGSVGPASARSPSMAALALALRFVPYSYDRGNFDVFWSLVMAGFGLLALGASVYLVYVLEILKLRRTGRIDPETGEIDAIQSR